MQEVVRALDEYANEIEDSPLKQNAKRTYILHSRNFVRWLLGDFEPGGTIKLK